MKTNKNARPVKQDPRVKVKVIAAVVLVLIMAVMWMRVFTKGKGAPTAVAAASVQTNAATKTEVKKTESNTLTYIELPIVAGRNDCLTRDIFIARSWNGGQIDELVDVVPKSDDEKLLRDEIRYIAQDLKFKAVIAGNEYQPAEVFIENKIVPVGSSFPIRREGKKFVFLVEHAQGNKVVLNCQDVTVTLKLSKKDEKSDQ